MFIINGIKTDSSERIFELKTKRHVIIYANSVEYDLWGEKCTRRSIGENLQGELYITFVNNHSKVLGEQRIVQPFKSSHIKVVGIVQEVVDDYTLSLKTVYPLETIRVEFEDSVLYTVGNKICIEGELWIDES